MLRLRTHITALTVLILTLFVLSLSASHVIAQKQIFVAVKGGAGAEYAHYTDGLGWDSEWKNVGGIVFGAPDICSPKHGELAVFVRSQDDRLFARRKYEKSWSDYELLSDGPYSEPSVVCGSGGHVDLFTVNFKNGQLMQ